MKRTRTALLDASPTAHCRYGSAPLRIDVVRQRPTEAAFADLFSEEEHSSAYVDPGGVEIRLAQVIQSEVERVLEVYSRVYDRRTPTAALDVGASEDYLVAGMRAYVGTDIEQMLLQAALRLDDRRGFDGLADLNRAAKAVRNRGYLCDNHVIEVLL